MDPYFALSVPDRGAIPILVEVPHAGLGVPDLVRDQIAVSLEDIERDADIYVDKLAENATSVGATLLTARVSRYVVDLNRAPDDVDRETVPDHPSPKAMQPRGVVWRMTTLGERSLTRPLRWAELAQRIEVFHAPYHRTIESELARLEARFGFAVLVAVHSMPSVGRGGQLDRGVRRADIVPGTRGRTTCDGRVIDLVDAHFRAAGLSVRHDDPYRGGYTTGHYGRPDRGRHAIQIEINRALYVNEATGEPKPDDFERLQRLLLELFERLGRLDLR
jgi:N-formylglutamate amidohydrolase